MIKTNLTKNKINNLFVTLGIGFSSYALSFVLPFAGTNCIFANNPNIKSKGGLEFGDSSNDPYWFKINGNVKLDQRLFYGDKKGNYHSGAQIRDLGLGINGGIGTDLSYTLGFSFDSKRSHVDVDDAFITYKGFKTNNLEFSIGQVNPGFSVEKTTSSKWTPFLERSLSSTAFAPSPGIGVSVNHWQHNYSLVLAITQPKANASVKNVDGSNKTRSDRWQTSARVTLIPYRNGSKLFQIGVSGHIQDDSGAGVEFSTPPEAKSRNVTTILNTTQTDNQMILANSHSTMDLEMAAQNGPFSMYAEYHLAKVNRSTSNGGGHLRFNGYYVQASYILTGEARNYDPKKAVFKNVVPEGKKGAWEVSARYSFINLNDKNVVGGSAHNTSVSLGCYVNENIRVLGEYIYSKQRERENLAKRKVKSVGARLQFVF